MIVANYSQMDCLFLECIPEHYTHLFRWHDRHYIFSTAVVLYGRDAISLQREVNPIHFLPPPPRPFIVQIESQ